MPSHAANIIDDEEFVLLYDVNKSRNPDYPYWSCDDEGKAEFRFLRSDIHRLLDIFQFPEYFTCYNGTVYDSTEALCIFLKTFAYPCRYLDMMPQFGRPVPKLSMISNHVMNILYESWSHLLRNFQQDWLSINNLETSSNAIHQCGAPLHNCWGFVDGTVRPISRPGRNQRIVYNGHKKVYALKYQSLVAPNGLVANLFGPVEGKRHDSGMLADSGLLQLMSQNCFLPNGSTLCIYGDPAYPLSVHLLYVFTDVTQSTDVTSSYEENNGKMRGTKVLKQNKHNTGNNLDNIL